MLEVLRSRKYACRLRYDTVPMYIYQSGASRFFLWFSLSPSPESLCSLWHPQLHSLCRPGQALTGSLMGKLSKWKIVGSEVKKYLSSRVRFKARFRNAVLPVDFVRLSWYAVSPWLPCCVPLVTLLCPLGYPANCEPEKRRSIYSENDQSNAGFTQIFEVGATRFELATSASRTQRSTRLSHAP
jgi:hypothetical protein